MTRRSANALLPESLVNSWRSKTAIGLLTLLLSLLILPFDGTAKGLDEHELRALFLFNFASFVRWPEAAFDTPSSPFRYCVVGNGEINRPLKSLLQGESVKDHRLDFKMVSADSIPDGCHLLYINPVDVSSTADIVAQLAGRPTLTVAADRDLIESGIMVALERQGSRIRPVVNLDTAQSSGLQFSAKLLQLSTVVSSR